MSEHRSMDESPWVLTTEQIPGRGGSVNPFLVIDDASGFITFAEQVFAAEEVREARTTTPEGLLIHAEVRIGDSSVLLADPQPGWPALPGLLQIWVHDAAALIERATAHGARTVTPPTPFYGALTLARIEDPWSNLWWIFQPAPGQPDPKPAWEGGSTAIFRTIDEYMKQRSRSDARPGPESSAPRSGREDARSTGGDAPRS